MLATIATIFCLAYILGLLLTGISITVGGIPLGAIAMLLLGITVAFAWRTFSVRPVWRTAPKAWVWLVAGLIGFAAVLHFQIRLPRPDATDICGWVADAATSSVCPLTQQGETASGTVRVTGLVKSAPQLTRNERLRFELAATQIQIQQSQSQTIQPPQIQKSQSQQSQSQKSQSQKNQVQQAQKSQAQKPPQSFQLQKSQVRQSQAQKTQAQTTQTQKPSQQSQVQKTQAQESPFQQPQSVTGNVYVTIPPSSGEQLYPGLTVSVTGKLYRPKPAANPGGFDFEKYLAQQGIFTGLNGTRLDYPVSQKPKPSIFWLIRQRIVQVQDFGLGSPEGALLSAMVMGKSAVNVPYDIQDQFKQTGLAHALAASGTQVSLLIGVLLAVTRHLPGRIRALLCSSVLFMYIGLTGAEASVLRAGIMGLVTLLALVADRKVNPIGSLLLAATLLLLINPIWVWDLGFQLSFLATLGLLVTVPVVTKWLDWLPAAISPMLAVPLAAYVWTLPIMLFAFGVVSPYSILVNIAASLLITVISIGGMISAVMALVIPAAGSLLAWLLYYPTYGFMQLAAWGSQLPGSSVAVGKISGLQILLLYGLIGLVWWWKAWHRYWWVAFLIGVSLVAVPLAHKSVNLSQVTVLATTTQPVLVVQDQGRVGLIHSGNAKDASFTVLPFLQQQGINQLDWAVAPSIRPAEVAAWQQIVVAKPVRVFYSNPDFDAAPANSLELTANPIPAYQAILSQIKATNGVALPLANSPLQLGSIRIERVFSQPDIFKIQFNQQTWLWLNGIPTHKLTDLMQLPQLGAVDLLGWSGKPLSPQFLQKVSPKAAIWFGEALDSATEQWFLQHQVQLYSLQQGAVQWTAGQLDWRTSRDL